MSMLFLSVLITFHDKMITGKMIFYRK